MSSEVPIPEAAIEAATQAWQAVRDTWLRLHGGPLTDAMLEQSTGSLIAKSAEDAVRAAAPLVVAAELERLADYYWPLSASEVKDYDDAEEDEREGVRSMCNALRFRASVLRGEGQTDG